MKYLLDTCVLSELVKPRSHPQVSEWLQKAQPDSLFLSVVTVGELKKGLHRLPSSSKKDRLGLWIQCLIFEYKERLLPFDLEIAENWGEILSEAQKTGRSLAAIDSLLAATAHTYHMTLVTRNEKDFQINGIRVLNLWN